MVSVQGKSAKEISSGEISKKKSSGIQSSLPVNDSLIKTDKTDTSPPPTPEMHERKTADSSAQFDTACKTSSSPRHPPRQTRRKQQKQYRKAIQVIDKTELEREKYKIAIKAGLWSKTTAMLK